MNQVVSEVLKGTVLPGLSAILLTAGVTLVREYIQHLRDARVRQLLLALVQAAEQIYGAGKGDAKRQYVQDQMKAKGLTPTRDAVEAAVYGMNQVAPQ